MKRYFAVPGSKLNLTLRDPGDTSEFRGSKTKGLRELTRLRSQLETLQELFYADGRHRLLVVLQGMDTSGKDGVIRHVFEGVNPQGVQVASFKQPSTEELSRDYLWRIHARVPSNGQIIIFNRSHYEDVLVARVRKLVSPRTWKRRYQHIVHFEQMLADEGVVIIKFFLHISRAEQRKRLVARLNDAKKHWKFSIGDLAERKRWPQYQRAYEAAIAETSTRCAPWYIIPSDRKWYRNLMISRILVEKLESLGLTYPEPHDNLKGVHVPR